MDNFVNLAEWCLIGQENNLKLRKKSYNRTERKKKLQFQQSIIPVIYIIEKILMLNKATSSEKQPFTTNP